MSTTEIEGKLYEARLHTHQRPDPRRKEYFGGPGGVGYLEGPMDDISFLANEQPRELVLKNENGDVVDILMKIVWGKADVMWKQGDHVHGIVHIDWE